MASDEEYVNYNNEESKNEYYNVTTNNNADQASRGNHPVERQQQDSNQIGRYSSKKRQVSLYDEDMYSLPIGADVKSTKEGQFENVMETLGEISSKINHQNQKPIWSIIKWILIIIACFAVITAGVAVVYSTLITGNRYDEDTDSSSNTNNDHLDSKPTPDRRSVNEGRTFKLFIDHGSDISYCDVKPPFTDEHLTDSKIEGMSKSSVFQIDNKRAKLKMSGGHCEVTISDARTKDTGKWDFQVSTAKNIRQFGQRHDLHHTMHYIFLVSVDKLNEPTTKDINDKEITTTSVNGDTSAIGHCWDSRLSKLISRSSMEQNGWAFANVGRAVVARSGRHDENCGKDSWYGWKIPGAKDPASVSALFHGAGSAVLDFGNCHVMGSIDVFLGHAENEVATKIDTTMAMETSRKVSFQFREGTILNITTTGGIIKLNRLSISCSVQCCSNIRIGSKDLADTKLPRSMGHYQKYKNDSIGNPVWKKGDNDFLFLDKNGFWSIGNSYNTTSGTIYHPTCRTDCPEQCSDDWAYSNPGWATNKTVDVLCARSPEIKGTFGTNLPNDLDIAIVGPTNSEGVLIWSNNKYNFNGLPTYLEYAYFFRIPAPIITGKILRLPFIDHLQFFSHCTDTTTQFSMMDLKATDGRNLRIVPFVFLG